ncbi:peptide-methionine (R)-S-oxide reductase MsrB [Aeoliella sp.]|uniref:peptide-methionine (R)-S-oxide reductase MsrB n=1 Tax=Aeoliella sp. TaxID=2795800 RepID=UPI003CCBE550
MRNYVVCLPLVALIGCEATLPIAEVPTAVPPVVTEAAMPESNSSAKKLFEKIEKTEEEWKKHLSEHEYHVLREKGTERAYTGEYDKHFEHGAYACAGCGLVLFESETKFDSRCGWPAFYAAKAGDRVVETADHSFGMVRVEVTCARCGGHLGHVFDDAPGQPTGQRFCINSVSLDFIPKAKLKAEQLEVDAPPKPAEPAPPKGEE